MWIELCWLWAWRIALGGIIALCIWAYWRVFILGVTP